MIKLAVVQMNSTLGDLSGNAAHILNFSRRAYQQGAHIVLTPELSLVGYPPEDLLLRDSFYSASQAALNELATQLAEFPNLHVLVGHPLMKDGRRYNAASLLVNGRIQASYCKQDLPNGHVFDEKRYFDAGQDALVFEFENVKFGVTICEDTWSAAVPTQAKIAGAQVLLVLNGSPFHMNKQHLRYQVMRDNVTQQGMALVYANLVGGQDELIFDGNSFVLDSQGQIQAQLKHAQEDLQIIEFAGATPQAGVIAPELSVEAQVYQALVLGVRDYIGKNGFPSVLLGMSGGVDSALTLAIAVDALGADKVRAVMMPSPYTAEISWLDSREMVDKLGVRYDEISINPCFSAFTATLAQEFEGLPLDATEENIQARIRGTLLMALSNKHGSIVLTTGNKSEMAVGYCTLYGDMAGGFAVLKDIAKTLVYRLCAYRNSLSLVIPERILTRPPSAELRPDQTDQDSLPPYEILDGIMQMHMEENCSTEQIVKAGYQQQDVDRITRLIKINEYKRRQSPVGIRVTHRAFGRDWRYPITSKFRD
ncbi:NAD+ synthase [Solimicrobium silvestre]|uniref:Glutamine-dependent NAD(+) synthetase n=1 Tax=Solimicrobium silvestre TaxID=2099400 RepID=A0A2S9GU89_9BURK|nr:NAD+ synthase [Solimicrobium silvestre]PRC91274.1 nadE: NAD+ synthetase [Solimicrobium silvestre]